MKDRSIEILEDRLYFNANTYRPQITKRMRVLNFDQEFQYVGYNSDFGPINIGNITLYCRKIKKELQEIELDARRTQTIPIHLVHHCSSKPKVLAN